MTGQMSSQWLREKMEEGMCRGACGMGCTDFDTCIFPGDLKRPEFWVWAGKESSEQRTEILRSPAYIYVYEGDYLKLFVCTRLKNEIMWEIWDALARWWMLPAPGEQFENITGYLHCHSGTFTSSSLMPVSHRHLNMGGDFLLLPRTPVFYLLQKIVFIL